MLCLVVNLGLKSIRGIVFDEEGRQLYAAYRPVHSLLLGNRVEQDPAQWRTLLQDVLAEITGDTSLAPDIGLVTVTTSSSCVFGVDNAQNAVTRVLMVNDRRAEAEASEIRASEAFKTHLGGTNVRCPASSVVAKALWLKRHRPEDFERVAKWVGAGEFLTEFFTGECTSDPLNASKALYVDADERYAEEVLGAFGLDVATFPRVIPMGTELALRDDVRRTYGYARDCRFVVTTYDAICAVFGSANGELGSACDVSGTVTSLRVLSHPNHQPNSRLVLSQNVDLVGMSLVGCSNNLGGGIIEWYKQAFYEAGPHAYEYMEREANASAVGANGIVFLPYLMGERAPFTNPHAKGLFFGMERSSNKNDISRAVLESTAFVTNDLMRSIEDSGIAVDAITVSGGLARLDAVNQMKADVTGKEILVAENFESTSLGAFVLAGIATGLFSDLDEAVSKTISIRKVIKPSPRNHAQYRELFSLFKDIYGALLPIYQKHHELKTKYAQYAIHKVDNL